jgi:hypothetical protein
MGWHAVSRATLINGLAGSTIISAGACAPQSGVQDLSVPYRAATVAVFRTSDDVDDAFAVPAIEVAEWSNATWTVVPPSNGSTITAYTETPSATPPVLFIMRKTPAGLSVGALGLTSTSPERKLDIVPVTSTGPIPGWCEGENWIGAFFMEGVGPVPDQPVILEYWGETSEHRLLVDPNRSTVRARPSLVVGDDQLRPVSEPRSRMIFVQTARGPEAAFPLIVHTNGTSTRAQVTGRSFANYPATWDLLEGSEWRVYFLSAIPGSDPWAEEPTSCDPGVA